VTNRSFTVLGLSKFEKRKNEEILERKKKFFFDKICAEQTKKFFKENF
jgi:hypothetical protein